MTPTAKRGVVKVLVEEHRLPCLRACRAVGFSRSAWYQPTVDWAVRDAPVMAVLNALIAGHTRWGFWKGYRPHESLGNLPPTTFLPRLYNPDASPFKLPT
jgi:hypothetical protein